MLHLKPYIILYNPATTNKSQTSFISQLFLLHINDKFLASPIFLPRNKEQEFSQMSQSFSTDLKLSSDDLKSAITSQEHELISHQI